MKEATPVYQLSWTNYQKQPEKLVTTLVKLGRLFGPIAVKTHFGEPGNNNALRGPIIKPVIDYLTKKKFSAFLTDTNTLYEGQRSDTQNHFKTAKKHGFADLGLPVIIAQDDDLKTKLENTNNQYQNLPVYLGRELKEADSILCLSHVKGHPMFGFGGALKNLGMGGATPKGKKVLHSGIAGKINHQKCLGCQLCAKNCPTRAISMVEEKMTINYDKCIGCGECISLCPQGAIKAGKEDLAVCQEKTAIYAYALVKDKPAVYINYLININPVCDCFSVTKPKLIRDLGLLVATDPVAIDQASLDWINKEAGYDLFLKANQINYQPILVMGEKIGLGKRSYRIQEIF